MGGDRANIKLISHCLSVTQGWPGPGGGWDHPGESSLSQITNNVLPRLQCSPVHWLGLSQRCMGGDHNGQFGSPAHPPRPHQLQPGVHKLVQAPIALCGRSNDGRQLILAAYLELYSGAAAGWCHPVLSWSSWLAPRYFLKEAQGWPQPQLQSSPLSPGNVSQSQTFWNNNYLIF